MPRDLVTRLVIAVVLDVRLSVTLAVAVSALPVAVVDEAAAPRARVVLPDVAPVVTPVLDHGQSC